MFNVGFILLPLLVLRGGYRYGIANGFVHHASRSVHLQRPQHPNRRDNGPSTSFSAPVMKVDEQPIHSRFQDDEHHSTIMNESCWKNIPDSVNRRHLLHSLLAAASGSSLFLSIPSPVIADDNTAIIQLTTDITTTTTVGEAISDWSTIEVMKPPLDDRDYRLTILDNGLRVVLCSDPSSNEAGAAMDVHVGACSDPKDIPGLAHFNERKTMWLFPMDVCV
jgi:hypothetical protein